MDELNGRMMACQILITGLIARVANDSPDPLRFLTDFRDEIRAVALEVSDRPDIDDIDIGAAILKIADEMPNPDDIERVRERLAAQGWPLDDPRDDDGAGA